MNKEQEEKWYNSFTKEQLIERCEYLQRSCERKEEQITDLDSENFDLENEIERLNNDIKVLLKENENKEKVIKAQDNIIKEIREYINKIPTQPVIRVFKKELLEILDKVDKENNNA